ncbi:Fanconi anemia core complex-associated protein 100 isoform X2 [Alligator mississippiensis]|uniref:Fanconi anemia core complex-associated protein 100 isoform A n=1 Tax=Alligator mississippiensis TaxID=8496 RepID=A0A151NJX9_ALLMI|nr:Fanconi anemia core complex-associated protein 100 isoform X2 [Alligator mississippiensis]KYO37092.1 Fanconi anemia core complex-associated protein 100 isoform A [Alligator mississippiensis]
MAAGPRVDYLAGFCCPVGGLAAGRPRVLCHDGRIYLSNGSAFVYVYDQEGRLLQAVYRFPDQVWHVELLPLHRQLYILCAKTGIYCLSLDQQSRVTEAPTGDGDGDSKEADGPANVLPVDADACIFPDADLCAFTLLSNFIITLAQAQGKWWMELHELPAPSQEPPACRHISKVGFSTGAPAGGDGDAPASRFLPVLCCALAPGSGDGLWCSGGFILAEPLFSLLFGVDAAMLDSPMILGGFPDGQLCSVPLKALSAAADADTNATAGPDPPVKVLHHLEEPVVFIGALRTERREADEADDPPLPPGDADCVVAVGHYGKLVAIKAGRREEAPAPELREYYLRGPVLCAACSSGSRMYYSTHSDISAVDLECGSNASDSEDGDDTAAGVLPPVLAPASLSICSVVALSLSSRAAEGESELLALSAKGRLMTCDLCSPEEVHPVRLTPDKAGQRIKELLSGIGNVSERVSFLKKAVDHKNRALTCLNQVLDVSAALLSGQDGAKPITCTITAAWSRLLLRDTLSVSCMLENSSDHSLEQGWTLCVQLLAGTCALDEATADTGTTYTFPVEQLPPGGQREVTLPLGTAEDAKLELPLTVSCALFYSLREILDSGPDSLDDLFPDDSPLLSPDREGICLPLSECTIDMLQCLRVGEAAGPASAPDPVEAFLETAGVQAESNGTSGSNGLGDECLVPSAASIKVSSELLKSALKDFSAGAALSCATLRWLLAENTAAEALSSQDVAEVRGLAPDGGEVQLLIREVAMNDLCPAGPIQAVEILIQSSSLADLCGVHHAVIGRIQALVLEQAAQGSGPPDLRMQYLRQIQANHETLLKEAQALRDRLCLGDEASATAEKLLSIYQQLRNPSLVLL